MIMQNDNSVSVGVCVMTYNHEMYIEQTIEGILMQETNFPVMIFIGEDCGADRTRQICIDYKEKYPDRITLLLHETNLGIRGNFTKTLAAAKKESKYMAICEGDDYWTDPNKLQKQIDFLEQNPDFALSSHNVDILWFGVEVKKVEPLPQRVFTVEDVIDQDWCIMTVSLVFRSDAFIIPESFHQINSQDYVIQLLVALNGKIGYMPESMAAYRKHAEGYSLKFTPLFLVIALSDLFITFNKFTKNKYKTNTHRKLLRICKVNVKQAKTLHLRKQYFALSISYYLLLAGINIFPLLSKIPVFYDHKRPNF